MDFRLSAVTSPNHMYLEPLLQNTASNLLTHYEISVEPTLRTVLYFVLGSPTQWSQEALRSSLQLRRLVTSM